MLLRRAPGAKPGAPTPEVAEAVAAVQRYFDGKETDFSRFKVDLGEQDPFFQRIYAVSLDERRESGHSQLHSQASLPAYFLAGRGIGVTPTCSSAVYGAP
jgi:hypothetical protein